MSHSDGTYASESSDDDGKNVLVCKWYHYTRCRKTYSVDQFDAWKEHVLSHYGDDENLTSAQPETMNCWLRDCHTARIVRDPKHRKDAFIWMLGHVYDHMKTEQVTVEELRNDDHYTIVVFWKLIEEKARAGTGISPGELQFLYVEHLCPRLEGWEFAARAAEKPTRAPLRDTGGRSELEAYDMRREDRERKREADNRKRKGKAVDRGEPSDHSRRRDGRA